MKYQIAQHTLAGARPENQDRIATVERDNAVLMILADGLGGHQGGAMAAEALVDTMAKAFQKVQQPTITTPSAFLALSIMHAHKVVNAHARAANLPLEARTTCVACLVQEGYAYWAHVGDSRLYHYRGHELVTRTVDHSTTEQLHQDGVLHDDDPRSNKVKSYLLKCVGGPQRPRVTLGKETRLLPSDTLLLCSDGVWQAFNNEELGDYLGAKSLDAGIEDMLFDAETRMGEACDNISAIALRWEDAVTLRPPLEPQSGGEIDQDMLWNAAKLQAKARREHKHKAPAADNAAAPQRNHDMDAIQSAIDELEAFVQELEKQT
jgi:serine/threonine protein phosphatase PrpC